jgi:hypothetical protein
MLLRLGQEIQEVLRPQLILGRRMARFERALSLFVAEPAPDIPVDCGGKCGVKGVEVACLGSFLSTNSTRSLDVPLNKWWALEGLNL